MVERAKLQIKPKGNCRWDLISLGEVMLRLDPGDCRIATTREFRVWEGGGEYNVARGLKRCFGMDTAIVTSLADNPVGRLVQDLIYRVASTSRTSSGCLTTARDAPCVMASISRNAALGYAPPWAVRTEVTPQSRSWARATSIGNRY